MIADLTYDAKGNLNAITGDGEVKPRVLYQINPADGDLSFLADLSDAPDDDCEALAFNQQDGMLYRLTGRAFFYKINLETFAQVLLSDVLYDDGTCDMPCTLNVKISSV